LLQASGVVYIVICISGNYCVPRSGHVTAGRGSGTPCPAAENVSYASSERYS
jgi:hypothetical protein